MPYCELLAQLNNSADEKYRAFHKKLLKNESINVIGVRVPVLRRLAKAYKDRVNELLTYPDEYYEVTFVKLSAVSLLKYGDFIKYIDICVPLIDNWATCDCFVPKCIEKHKDEFLSYIEKYSSAEHEFYQRFALTTLLHFYVEDEYTDIIKQIINKCNLSLYYVHMAAAWLVAEMLVKNFETAKNFLLENSLDIKTHNKAIRKACESFRLSEQQKNYLKGIKR